ncbi:reverse transcriptase domain-containing protein [Roseobacter sp.]|uniref:reverse transcriptase domain-containing protein n=1 Tax=Roseobacter sp. TaxID=1907202 RepID=UPI00296705C9|nr:reverse transcriptase domain-containing protein [Roseobacter sp.]MDW3181635.1 reverse transcriptase domain-containing protein [Roseobacter sp.]
MNENQSLYQSVYAESNVFEAWRHVKKSALNSPNKDIRGEATEFEHRHQTHLRRISRQLRENRYQFSPVHGVLKDKIERLKKGKNPRPVAIAKMEDRVVQRAILQVFQPRRLIDPKDPNSKSELIYDPRLGLMNKINRSEFGVGGLLRPYGGTEQAIRTIMRAMESGATHFFQSDIKAFFTAIPTAKVIDIVRAETKDECICTLFGEALKVDLENEDELKKYSDLFPRDGIGVAQGGSLSALAGNILLFEFDHALNTKGVTAVRYIDDVLIVSDSKQKLDDAVHFTKGELSKFNFSLYPPDKSQGKADEGLCADSFNFLGCTIQPKRCVPSKASVDGKKAQFSSLIHSSKGAIKKYLQNGDSLDPKLSQSVVLKRIGDQLYGWQKSFSFCTDEREFETLDNHVFKLTTDYAQTIQRWNSKVEKQAAAKVLGIPSAREQFILDKQRRDKRNQIGKI